jgi:hypothetical protein
MGRQYSTLGRIAGAAIATAGIAAVVGCGASERAATVPAPLTDVEQRRLEAAEARLTERCVRDHGLRLPTPATREQAPAAARPTMPRATYGNDDVDWARRHGFGADNVGGFEPSARPSERRRISSRATRRLQHVLFGDRQRALTVRLPTGYVVATGENGCLAEAQRQLYGDQAAWFRSDTLVSNIGALAEQQASKDPTVRARRRAWSACLARAGYAARTPVALRKRFLDRATSLTATAREAQERQMAVAEARCGRRTAFTAVGERAVRRATLAAERRFRPQITTQRRLARSALARLRRHAL